MRKDQEITVWKQVSEAEMHGVHVPTATRSLHPGRDWHSRTIVGPKRTLGDSIQGSSTPLKDKDEALETPRRPITRSQTKEFNDKLNGLQSLIQMCLIGEEELKPKGEKLSKCYNYLVAQIQAQDEEF
uniref:Gag-pol polyprotein n=1 Tax=Solanum tuberosum TaxID=4113 RepID=M1DX47_SOLTU